jgi:hypothetical protein
VIPNKKTGLWLCCKFVKRITIVITVNIQINRHQIQNPQLITVAETIYTQQYNLMDKKVKLSLCLINKALHHEYIWGSGCIHPRSFDLGTNWRCVWSPSCPGRFTPRERAPSTHLIRGRPGRPQSRSVRRGEEKIRDPTGT